MSFLWGYLTRNLVTQYFNLGQLDDTPIMKFYTGDTWFGSMTYFPSNNTLKLEKTFKLFIDNEGGEWEYRPIPRVLSDSVTCFKSIIIIPINNKTLIKTEFIRSGKKEEKFYILEPQEKKSEYITASRQLGGFLFCEAILD